MKSLPSKKPPSKFFVESRKTLSLAAPIIIGNLGQTVIAFTDTFMVGRLGAESLAAAGFSGGLLFVFILFGFGLLAPAAALVSRSFGRGETQEISELLKATVLLSLGLSLVLMIFLWGSSSLLAHMGQTPEVVRLSKGFFGILVASLMPSLVFQAYKQFTDGLGHTRIGMYVTGAAVVLNAVGNFILIHGISIHGTEISPAFGLNGSALASLFSRWMMAVLIILYVHRSRLFKKYTETAWHRSPPWSRYAQLLRLGIPNGLTYVFEVGAFTFSSVMMGWIGAAPLAAHQVALNLASISFLVTAGIGVAASIRVGFELGQHRVEEARFAGRTAVGLGAGFMLASAVTVFLGREWLAHVYTQDLQVIAFAASFLGIAAAFQFFDGVQAVAVGVLRGLQDTHWPSILALIAYWVVGLPLGYFLTFKTGLQGDGIWWGLFVGLTLTAIFLTVRMERAFSQLRSDRVSRS